MFHTVPHVIVDVSHLTMQPHLPMSTGYMQTLEPQEYGPTGCCPRKQTACTTHYLEQFFLQGPPRTWQVGTPPPHVTQFCPFGHCPLPGVQHTSVDPIKVCVAAPRRRKDFSDSGLSASVCCANNRRVTSTKTSSIFPLFAMLQPAAYPQVHVSSLCHLHSTN